MSSKLPAEPNAPEPAAVKADPTVFADYADCKLHLGDARAVLAAMPAKSVHSIITSPPYWNLRDYKLEPSVWGDGWTGCLGLEPRIEMYVEHMVEVMAGCWRVLRDDGSMWLNIGDSYAGSGHGWQMDDAEMPRKELADWDRQRPPGYMSSAAGNGLKPKALVLAPFRVVDALQRAGWICRSTIIWSKRSPMPESVQDRATTSHEYIYQLVKRNRPSYWTHRWRGGVRRKPAADYIWRDLQADIELATPPADWKTIMFRDSQDGKRKRRYRRRNLWRAHDYFYDQTATREPMKDTSIARYSRRFSDSGTPAEELPGRQPQLREPSKPNELGRNAWTVWDFPTESTKEKHFATFPRELVRRCLAAGTPVQVCDKCGAARVWSRRNIGRATSIPTCACNDGRAPATVLDPFGGSGTVAVVAREYGRQSIMIDLAERYLQIAARRLETVQPVLIQEKGRV